MIYDASSGIVFEGNAVVAIYDRKDVPVGCHLDADKTYYIEALGRTQKILAKGDEAVLLLLAGRFKLETLEKAVIYEKKVDVRLLPLFRGAKEIAEGVTNN